MVLVPGEPNRSFNTTIRDGAHGYAYLDASTNQMVYCSIFSSGFPAYHFRNREEQTMANFRLRIRQGRPTDIPALIALDKKIYGEFGAATDGSIERRVLTFPSGVLIAEEDGEIRGAVYLRPLDRALNEKSALSWAEAENEGNFTPAQNFQFMYGVGFVATGGMNDIMTLAAMRCCIEHNIQEGYFGSRIPTLSKSFPSCPDKKTVQIYVQSGQDWEIRMYGKAGPLGLKIAETSDGYPVVIEEYFDDPESWDYGVLWIWKNRWRGLLKWVGIAVFSGLLFIERFYTKRLNEK